MKAYDLVKMAGGNLVRRKLRTSLTVLGIVIGSISILLMVALGLGLKDSINEEFAGFTSVNVIEVYKGSNVSQRARLSEVNDGFESLDDLDLEFFQSIEGVEFASPSYRTSAKLISGQYENMISIVGVEPEVMDDLGFTLKSGRYLTNEDTISAIFGYDAITSFEQVFVNQNQYLRTVEEEAEDESFDFFSFDRGGDQNINVDVMVDRIQMTMDSEYSVQSGATQTPFKVYSMDGVGILKAGDATRDSNVFMHIDFVKKMVKEYYQTFNAQMPEGYHSAFVKVENIEDVKRVNKIIQSKGYQSFAIASILDTVESTLQVVQIALGAIGGISLVVAAIGITNTMVMAITERKKEIGVMKVIGATINDIKWLFLTEAAMIGCLGGAIGVSVSWGISKLISSPAFSQMMSGGSTSEAAFSFTIPLWLILSGLGFTTLVGILSGYLPARQAMRSSALEAIRNE